MLIVLTGENRLELLVELDRDMKKRSLTEADRFAEDTFSVDVILATLEQQDLFGGGGKAIVLDQFGSFAEGKQFLEEEAERLANSAKAVYLLEASVSAALGKVFAKAGAEVRAIGASTKGRGSPPIFALSDALAARDKKALWILYRDLSKKAEPEEIAGIFVWQLKTMWLVARGETAGINPYVVTKARTALKNFKSEEVPKLLFKLIGDYHRGHRGEGNLSVSLERFILVL